MEWWGVSLTTHVFRVSPLLSSPAIAPFPSSNPTTTCHDILHQILLESEVSGPEALGDDSSPEAQALRWIAYEDLVVLDLDSMPIVILVERYVIVLLYFATLGTDWRNQQNFLASSSVCEWKNRELQTSDA